MLFFDLFWACLSIGIDLKIIMIINNENRKPGKVSIIEPNKDNFRQFLEPLA